MYRNRYVPPSKPDCTLHDGLSRSFVCSARIWLPSSSRLLGPVGCDASRSLGAIGSVELGYLVIMAPWEARGASVGKSLVRLRCSMNERLSDVSLELLERPRRSRRRRCGLGRPISAGAANPGEARCLLVTSISVSYG
jgi:hypothetical protein